MVCSQTDKEMVLKKQAQAEVPADSDQYIIGAEDVLYIHVWREDTLSRTVPVRMDGKISLPLVDEIRAAGFTPLQLKELLIQRLKEFVDIPNISVIVMEANSFKVFVSGEVNHPGVYRLRAETTLVQIISLAGDFTGEAESRKIVIIRRQDGKDKRLEINYQEIISGTNLESNFVLRPGDTVFVPPRFR
jgi:polysaccharide export outer membrane protein